MSGGGIVVRVVGGAVIDVAEISTGIDVVVEAVVVGTDWVFGVLVGTVVIVAAVDDETFFFGVVVVSDGSIRVVGGTVEDIKVVESPITVSVVGVVVVWVVDMVVLVVVNRVVVVVRQ